MEFLRKPTPTLLPRERNMGLVYLAFQMLCLPPMLEQFDRLLGGAIGDRLNFLYFFINFLSVCLIFRHLLKRSLIRAIHHPRDVLLTALIGFLIYWLSTSLLSALISGLFPDYVNQNDSGIISMTESTFGLTAFGVMILVPVAEETLYRGLVFGSLYPQRPVAAYILSTLLFAAIHVMGYVSSYAPLHFFLAFVQYLPAGILLAAAYHRTGSLLTPMLIHTAVNTIGILTTR